MSQLEASFLLKRESFTLDLEVQFPLKGVTAIFGHSGCGKTSLLRCIAGLERAEESFLCVGGEIWQDERHFLPAHKRPVGYVFQDSALFAHLTARGNLAYALKRAGKPNLFDLEQVVELLDLRGCLGRTPAQLSGGERQRVAIARH